MTSSPRRDEIAANVRQVRERIAAAASGAGRSPEAITLVVVTKTFPADDIRLLHELGVRDIGENRHQEAAEKAAQLRDLKLTWHFVGQVQSNKAAAIAAYADVVHSVDSARVAKRLGAAARRHQRELAALVQVNLDSGGTAPGRGGVPPDAVAELARTVAGSPGLLLRGLMAVAPQDEPAADAFTRLADIWRTVRDEHPAADLLSAGMSGDFGDAIRAGATHVRVGSAVLGSRPPLR